MFVALFSFSPKNCFKTCSVSKSLQTKFSISASRSGNSFHVTLDDKIVACVINTDIQTDRESGQREGIKLRG